MLSFLFFHPSNWHLFPPSLYPSGWLIQMHQVWGCVGLRLFFREKILTVCFPPLCLQLLIFQSDWSHNCLHKDGHYLPSVFAAGNEAKCPQGRKQLPICRDIDDDFEKGWKEVTVILCWEAAYGSHPSESVSKWQLLWKKGNCFERFSGGHYSAFSEEPWEKIAAKFQFFPWSLNFTK